MPILLMAIFLVLEVDITSASLPSSPSETLEDEGCNNMCAL